MPVLDPSQPTNFGGLGLGEYQRGELVPVATIDSLELPRCGLLKVDVEGHELDVLRGALRMLEARRVRLVTFEFGGTSRGVILFQQHQREVDGSCRVTGKALRCFAKHLLCTLQITLLAAFERTPVQVSRPRLEERAQKFQQHGAPLGRRLLPHLRRCAARMVRQCERDDQLSVSRKLRRRSERDG